jgi:type II secretory pathway pseudopilin PulG
MAKHTKFSNCRFPSSQRGAGSDGIVLIVVMLVATLLLVALTGALPSVYQEGQRDREQELIFRGTQYARAVALFHRQFGRYPSDTKELLGTNGIRFLRKEYLDPMDSEGKWRFIHVNASGVLLDSINQPLDSNQNNPNGAGAGTNSSASSMLGGNSSTGASSQTGYTSPSFGDPNAAQGGFIAGVAATSHRQAIKIWQKHEHYDEWEFLGIDMGIFGIQVGMPNEMLQPSSSPGSGAAPGAPSATSLPNTN